ncbi:fumarylacetoacetate hydrolase-like protein [Tricladium varicosporioides]|nr:fumarylacetoacetate hydrolase-like protein [Hymenoscyphus varicosporioides]
MDPIVNENSRCPPKTLTNYVAYISADTPGQSRIGHLDLESSKIQPLTFVSGTPLTNLYEVIEAGESYIKPSESEIPIPLSSVQLLPPISGRDILAVGKNYREHAITEINPTGYDCDRDGINHSSIHHPKQPIVFTKRSTSIIASGEPIYPHPAFTETIDYGGEIGVIIGKSGFKIEEAKAIEHIWGYTIINDVTARDRQEHHKQLFLGKSPDTFCPMGPIAVPANKLPRALRIQTYVNGLKRQDSASEDLIFSIPSLIKTISQAQTLQLGDVLATGTPAGSGFSLRPAIYLRPGDTVEISVTGLGTLRNTVEEPTANNQVTERAANISHIPWSNSNKTPGATGLTTVGSKKLYYRHLGIDSGENIIFIHGLGGTSEYFTPLISLLGLEKTHSLHLLDLEGHGLSPTSALSTVTLTSYAEDWYKLCQQQNIKKAIVIGHSMGSMVALNFVISHPEICSKLILMSPSESPMGEAKGKSLKERAAIVRKLGIPPIVQGMIDISTSPKYKPHNPNTVMEIHSTLLGQDPEGYAKGCVALGTSTEALPVSQIKAKTLFINGEDDHLTPTANCIGYQKQIEGSQLEVISQAGHWHIFEDAEEVANYVGPFIRDE